MMWFKLIGPGTWSTIFGVAFGVVLDARVMIETHGEPHTIGDWLTLLLGVLAAAMGRAAK